MSEVREITNAQFVFPGEGFGLQECEEDLDEDAWNIEIAGGVHALLLAYETETGTHVRKTDFID